jgi:hypothetical protein
MKDFAEIDGGAVWPLLVTGTGVEPQNWALRCKRHLLQLLRPVRVSHDETMAPAGNVRIAGPDAAGLDRSDERSLSGGQNKLLRWIEWEPEFLCICYADSFELITW